MNQLSQRACNLKSSPTLRLNQKTKELRDRGEKVISFATGEPQWQAPQYVIETEYESLKKGATRYTPSSGIEELKSAIVNKIRKNLFLDYEVNDVSVSTGAKFATFAGLQILCDPKDEVIVIAPYWVSYPEMIRLAGATPSVISTSRESNFKLTAEQLKRHINENTKALILNNPVNPTAQVYTKQELEGLAKVLRRHPQVFVLCDDVYYDLSFSRPTHFLEIAGDLKDRTLLLNSVSKSYSMTGWRIGWSVCSHKEVISAINKYQSQSISCTSHAGQFAAAAALQSGDLFIKESLEKLIDKKNFVMTKLSELDLKAITPQATFYLWVCIEDYLTGPLKTSREFSEALLEKHMVVAVPGIDFGLDGYLRLSYCLSFEDIREGLMRLKLFTSSLKN